MTKTNCRIGLVGAGAIAQLAHLPVLAKIKGAQLVALCDNDGPKASAIAERLGIPDVFTDFEDLLAERKAHDHALRFPHFAIA